MLEDLQTHFCKMDLHKIELTYRGEWLIHGRKHHRDYQSQSLKHPYRIYKLGWRITLIPESWTQMLYQVLAFDVVMYCLRHHFRKDAITV